VIQTIIGFQIMKIVLKTMVKVIIVDLTTIMKIGLGLSLTMNLTIIVNLIAIINKIPTTFAIAKKIG